MCECAVRLRTFCHSSADPVQENTKLRQQTEEAQERSMAADRRQQESLRDDWLVHCQAERARLQDLQRAQAAHVGHAAGRLTRAALLPLH